MLDRGAADLTRRKRPMIRARRRLATRSRAQCPDQQDRERVAAAERQRRSRHRHKMLALGFEEVTLWLPPEVKLAWAKRERSSDPNTPLAFEHYATDLSDVLAEWAVRQWLSRA